MLRRFWMMPLSSSSWSFCSKPNAMAPLRSRWHEISCLSTNFKHVIHLNAALMVCQWDIHATLLGHWWDICGIFSCDIHGIYYIRTFSDWILMGYDVHVRGYIFGEPLLPNGSKWFCEMVGIAAHRVSHSFHLNRVIERGNSGTSCVGKRVLSDETFPKLLMPFSWTLSFRNC